MGRVESHEAGFPPFPHALEIPSGLPHSHGLEDRTYVFSCPFNSNHRYRKGLVTDVSGPQRNGCPGTLTPLRSFGCCFCSSEDQGRRCGQERDCYECMVRRATAREKFGREDKSAQMYSSIRAKALSRAKVSCPLLEATLGVRA
jgi:hypothetical protein